MQSYTASPWPVFRSSAPLHTTPGIPGPTRRRVVVCQSQGGSTPPPAQPLLSILDRLSSDVCGAERDAQLPQRGRILSRQRRNRNASSPKPSTDPLPASGVGLAVSLPTPVSAGFPSRGSSSRNLGPVPGSLEATATGPRGDPVPRGPGPGEARPRRRGASVSRDNPGRGFPRETSEGKKQPGQGRRRDAASLHNSAGTPPRQRQREGEMPAVHSDSGVPSGGGVQAPLVPPPPGGYFPFHDFVHSYSETPKTPPLGYREPQFSPFGPADMAAPPWTGGAPITRNRKKIYSGTVPGLHKYTTVSDLEQGGGGEGEGREEGAGWGHGEVQGQEEGAAEDVLGRPLSAKEVQTLVEESNKESRQINLGRDGVVHNMLDLVHTHWKRRRVCRVKCKGVPTVDMDNVVATLEARTGGKVIHRAGGSLYLFRGRHYKPKARPKIPIMLWKPPAPIYPRLVEEAPAGLTAEEANALRVWGRRIKPLCRLAKNGVYLDLVHRVRETLELHPLCRVDCRGLDKSDYKKIGAKLRDLVPCVLLSFERDQVLMWRDHPGRRPKVLHPAEIPSLEDSPAQIQAREDGTAVFNEAGKPPNDFPLDSSSDAAFANPEAGTAGRQHDSENGVLMGLSVSGAPANSTCRAQVGDGVFFV